MVKQNKLNKHHKSKSYFYFKDFAFGLIATIGIVAMLIIPTYIASNNKHEAEIKAVNRSEESENQDILTNDSNLKEY